MLLAGWVMIRQTMPANNTTPGTTRQTISTLTLLVCRFYDRGTAGV
jgi:hypothetical protein